MGGGLIYNGKNTLRIRLTTFQKSLKLTEEINGQLDIELGHFMDKDAVLKKIKSRKAVGLDEIPDEVWKTRKFGNILL